ncbi:hypothetical protein ACA910_020654 [Epithemia clementina (nom. ined.)]
MSISYEEALSTLQGMFGEQWSLEQLDTVLRHQKGHMENTVDLILSHGNRNPSVLMDKLNAGEDPTSHTIDADAELARQLATQQRQATAGQQQRPQSRTGQRGTPTQLPPDFLRITDAPATTTSSDQLQSDEALARMLQDNLFSEEISRNPDFAHLARGGRSADGSRARAGAAPAGGIRPSRTQHQTPDIDIMKSLGELGMSARRRLQMLAAQFNAKTKPHGNAAAAGGGGSGSTTAERRGLLNDDLEDDVALEFATRKDD